MRRGTIGLLVLLLLAAATAGATARSTAQAQTKVTKLKVWVGWSSRELSVFKKIVAEYDKKHPEVSISVVGGIDDPKIVAAIRGGNAADVTSSFDSTNVGNYCTSGAWINLKPLLDKDKIPLSTFPKTSVYYTSYKGVQCALPFLADTWGLYYNTTLFKKAGIKSPPKTFDELTADAKKLTQKNKDGSLKVVGYNPARTFYAENMPVNYGHLFGAKWLTGDGKSNLSKDPAWGKYLRWSKSLIDWYGYDKLKRWQARVGDEFSASNAFETGKLAMQIDGEWRVAFIAAEHPELKYGTAPMPVDSTHKDLYGSNNVNGTIIGIPKTTKHKAEAWALVKYLTTNSHPLALFSNGIRNVPTTKASLNSPEIKPDPHFKTFLKIFANPKNTTFPITPVGSAFGTFFNNFVDKYQAGHASDLSGGLKKVDKQTDAQLKQAGGGVP
jgi:ABC-type glycerol-3-phosphate transport system substrate-binding protein